MTSEGKTAPVLGVVIGAVVILLALMVLAWGAGKQYRELNRTLQDARAASEAQQKEITAIRAELGQLRAHLIGIREIAARARTKIVEYHTEVTHASDAVDALPDADVQLRLRAVADAYLAEHAQPVPAHQ